MTALLVGFVIGGLLAGSSAVLLLRRRALLYRHRWKEALRVIESATAEAEGERDAWRLDWERLLEANERYRVRTEQLDQRYRRTLLLNAQSQPEE